MIIMVELIPSLAQFLISNDTESIKKMPQMKARRDKNNSQRMDDFRVK
jgi:hypothetical protein